MGRKTNSVSLRLKKTNRDYNNCWYGDILYAENFSKSLKIGNYLSQTLKTIGMPLPQASVIGAFKKASLLVCYLDPKKRKRLLEKSSKGLAPAKPPGFDSKDHASQSKQSNTIGFPFFSLGQIKQNSKALLKPLEAIFETSFSGPLSLENSIKQHLVATPSFARGGRDCKNGIVMHKKPPIVTDKNDFTVKVKNIKHIVSEKVSKKTAKPINYMYRGSLGLEFNQSLCIARSYARVFDFMGVQKKEKEVLSLSLLDPRDRAFAKQRLLERNKKNKKSVSDPLKLVPLERYKGIKHKGLYNTSPLVEKKIFSKNSISFNEPTFFSFLQESEKKRKPSRSEGSWPFGPSRGPSRSEGSWPFGPSHEKDKVFTLSEAKGDLQFFPYIFENTVIAQKEKQKKKTTRFNFFSDFFSSEKNRTLIICAFNKNLTIFGKNTDLSVSNASFPCLSELVLNTPSCTKDYIKNILVEKEQLCKKEKEVLSLSLLDPRDQAFAKQRLLANKNGSLTSLYGFYNGFSHFWENAVSLSLYKSTNETSCALFLADTVSYLLERKILFRSIKRQLLLELNQSKSLFSVPEFPKLWGVPSARAFENKKKVIGIRISCSGRVGGRSKKAQRSRKDTFMWGETGLHVFSSKLDFSKTHAETPFGVVGVQVWVCTK